MKKLMALVLVAMVALTLGTSGTAAQSAAGTISGKAVRWDGQPIAGATIALLSGSLETAPELASTTTAADGTYTLSVPAGQPVWVHIRTFGSWWGYSYTPMSLQAGENVSQVYFALGPRDVKDVITLPTPISDVQPITGTNDAPPAAPPVVVPVQPVAPPVSNVKPLVGSGGDSPASPPAAKPTHPKKQPVKPQPVQSRVKPLVGGNLPQTGANDFSPLAGVLGLALAGMTLGVLLRRRSVFTR